MASFDIQDLRDQRRQREADGRERREIAAADYPEARALAEDAGLYLTKNPSEHGNHYLLGHAGRGWEIHLYPGNQRIYPNKLKRWAPHLAVSYPWRLEDAVNLAIKAIGERS